MLHDERILNGRRCLLETFMHADNMNRVHEVNKTAKKVHIDVNYGQNLSQKSNKRWQHLARK